MPGLQGTQGYLRIGSILNIQVLVHGEIDEVAEVAERDVDLNANQGAVVDVEPADTTALADWASKREDEERKIDERVCMTCLNDPCSCRENEKAQSVEEREASGYPTTFEPDDAGQEKLGF